MKLLIVLTLLTAVYCIHKECNIQECCENQPSEWFIRIGNRKSARLVQLCAGDYDKRIPIHYEMFGNYTISCQPFEINCQAPPVGVLIVRCSYYEDFIEYHDVRVVLDFL
uniref:ORF8 protein n=1 Tax=Rhinolophus thomasi bat coronavirus TaxID=3061635 RepID=A0AA95NP36_9BETC|nr:ORF8 protein [Rhinolophus thomasi bat coronavirus]